MLLAATAVSLGAALGALVRWGLGAGLNHLFPALPAGTLLANLVGGYGVGLAVALLGSSPALAPEWRLFVITGFLGGLTTFSTFSAEVVQALQRGQLGACGRLDRAHAAGPGNPGAA
jgi:fluoride exporter